MPIYTTGQHGAIIPSEALEREINTARSIIRSDPEQARIALTRTLEIAERHGYKRLAADSRLYLVRTILISGDITGLECMQRQALAYYRSIKARRQEATALVQLSVILEAASDDHGALRASERAARIYEKLEQPEGLSSAYNRIANILRRIGDLAKALRYNLLALELAERVGNDSMRTSLHNNLGLLYRRMGDAEAAIAQFQRGIEVGRKSGDQLGEAIAHSNLAGTYVQSGDLDAAIEHGLRAHAMFVRLGATEREGNVLHTLGKCHETMGDPKSAFRYYEEAEALLKGFDCSKHYGALLHSIASLHTKQERFERAEAYFRRAIEVAGKNNDRPILFGIYQDLYNFYMLTGDTAAALEAYRQHVTIREETIGVAVQRKLSKVQRAFEERQTRRVAAAGRKEAARLEAEIAERDKQLHELSLQLAQKNELLQKLRSQIQHGQQLNGTVRSSFREMIDNEVRANDGLTTFMSSFDTLHHGFSTTLCRRFPELTSTEIKVCCLARINLSSKEIASMLHITSRTVELHRTRIRKKCGLMRDESLTTYLTRL